MVVVLDGSVVDAGVVVVGRVVLGARVTVVVGSVVDVVLGAGVVDGTSVVVVVFGGAFAVVVVLGVVVLGAGVEVEPPGACRRSALMWDPLRWDPPLEQAEASTPMRIIRTTDRTAERPAGDRRPPQLPSGPRIRS